jgi:hypothetical protein
MVFRKDKEPGGEVPDLLSGQAGIELFEDLHHGVFGFFAVVEVFKAYAVNKVQVPAVEFADDIRVARVLKAGKEVVVGGCMRGGGRHEAKLVIILVEW